MPLNDDQHRVARRIKDLEQRLSDLEQQSRSTDTPNMLLTLEDSVGLGDGVESVRQHDLQPARWGETGWATSTWSDE